MAQKRSRLRFAQYRQQLRANRRNGKPTTDKTLATGGHPRSFWRLFIEFWRMLDGHHLAIVFALATLTVATLLALVPPAATKLMIDNVLTGKPLAPPWTTFFPTTDGGLQLLWWLAGGVMAISLVETAVRLWGRWYATRTVMKVQVSTRRRAFEHAVRLPLHRVQQLKSGGVASILRDDAGGIAELIFSMLYNPWRAIIQLFGSLAVLAWIDWRLLLGSLVLLPVIFLTHRTWIARIRPLYRDIRIQRQDIDSTATEAFAGMRVVRAFGRQRSESGRFTSANHFMARQQLHVWWWARIVELIWEIIIPLSSAALLLYGGAQVLEGDLTLGDLMMFLVYLAMLLSPLAVLANSAAAFQSRLAGLDRVLDLLAEPYRDDPHRGLADDQEARRSRAGLAARRQLSLSRFERPGAGRRRARRGRRRDHRPGRPQRCGQDHAHQSRGPFLRPHLRRRRARRHRPAPDRRRKLSPVAGHRRAGRVSVRRQRGRQHRLRRPRRRAGQHRTRREGRQRPRVHRRASIAATTP